MTPTQTGSRFTGRRAVVTGAAGAIGAACAARLAAEGATVYLTDLTQAALQPALEAARRAGSESGHGGTAHARVLDVGDEDNWSALAADLLREAPGLDLLLSNAAISLPAPAGDLDPRDWNRTLGVNLTAAYLGVRALLPLLLARTRRAQEPGGTSAVVLTSSVHALRGLPGHPAYAASKGGLLALAQQLAVDYGPALRVNTVVPGPIRSAAWDGIPPETVERSARATVAGRLGRPQEVAAAVAFLGSEDASFVTGAHLVVDGGWSISVDSA